MRKAWVLLAAVIAIVLGTMLQPSPMWVAVVTGDGAPVSCTRVRPGEEITLEFTHSMFGGYVRETWRATTDGQLERVRFVTEKPASAEYYATEVSSFAVDDGWEVPLDPLVQQSLVVRVNQRGKHQLHVGGTTVPLARLLPGSTQVHISISTTACNV